MKKILLFIFLFLITINVHALTCEYKVDQNNFGLVITVGDDKGVNANFSNGFYLMPGTTNNIGDFIYLTENSTCPSKAYYSCNASHFCKLDTKYFVDNNATYYGVLELKSQSSGSSGSGGGNGGATVSSVIGDFQSGNTCGGITGLTDLVDTYIKKPLIILGAVLFLVFTTLEYAKVVISDDASPKKANENTVKRAIGFTILSLSPYIINLLLTLAGIPFNC